MPEVVTEAPIDDKYLTVWYDKLVPLLIQAIKEQQIMIEELAKDSHTPKSLYELDGFSDILERLEKLEQKL